jgi:hypothetical protein
MAHQIIARSEPVALALPGRTRAARIATARAPAWRRTMFWPAELLRLIGVAFLFPVVILALGLPVAFALTGLLLAAQWVWHILA